MKKNKILFNLVVGLLFFGLTSSISSCGKDEEKEDPREKYVGTYDVEYTCTNSNPYGADEDNDYSLFFILEIPEGSQYDDNVMKVTNLPGIGQPYIEVFNDNFVSLGGGTSGTITSSRMIFEEYSHSPLDRDCELPFTAYKR